MPHMQADTNSTHSSTLDLATSKIVITGGTGFLGQHLQKVLRQRGALQITALGSKDIDVRIPEQCFAAFEGADIVIHLAANVGGIGYNQAHPAELFYDNLLMGVHSMHQAYLAKVKKYVGIGTICAYPKITPVPFLETDLWNGYPEETNAPYGLAKKMLLVQAQAYRQQYGFNAIYLLPTNLYGPGDNFNPDSSHVVPALIRKFIEAKEKKTDTVTVWGSGKPTREFLYVEDAALGITLATEKYNGSEPVNLGSQQDISIGELAKKIAELVGFKGTIVFDASKPDGQPKRKVSAARAKQEFGFVAQTTFEDGLKKSIEWYMQHPKR